RRLLDHLSQGWSVAGHRPALREVIEQATVEVGRVADELIIHRTTDTLPDLKVVEDFQHLFPTAVMTANSLHLPIKSSRRKTKSARIVRTSGSESKFFWLRFSPRYSIAARD